VSHRPAGGEASRRGFLQMLGGSAAAALLPLPASLSRDKAPPALFTDVTAAAGLSRARNVSGSPDDKQFLLEEMGGGVAFFDFDNDGWLDIFLVNGTSLEANVRDSKPTSYLFRNNRDGTFTDVTEKAGLVDPRWSLNGAWLDYDRDGDLDLFVSNYLEYDAGKFRSFYAAAGYPGPLSYNGVSCTLYRNNGDGTFTDVTKAAGVFNVGGRAMSVVAADLNNDGWMDVYVANDSMENYYYENKRDGTFAERALELGLALGQNGQGVSSMGPAVADLDGDGHLDILIPDMDYGSLLSKKGEFYSDLVGRSGLAVICGQYTGWGAVLLDYDNDGNPDVFIANGNAHHEYPEDAVLTRNNGEGVFVDVARDSGDFFQTKWVSRGATWADFDDDGNVDLLVVDTSGPPHLLRNMGGTGNHWLKVEAKVKGGGRTAIGARVTVTAGGRTRFQELIGVNGYLSQGDTRVHFGLGTAEKADLVEVRWPEGTTESWKDVKADQTLRVEKGKK